VLVLFGIGEPTVLVPFVFGVEEEGVETHGCLMVRNEFDEVVIELKRVWVLLNNLK